MSIYTLEEDQALNSLPFGRMTLGDFRRASSEHDILIISDTSYLNDFDDYKKGRVFLIIKNSYINYDLFDNLNLILVNEFSANELLLLCNLIDDELIMQNNHCMLFSMKSSLGMIDYSIKKIEGFLIKIIPDLANFEKFRINIVSRELLTNSVRHGNNLDMDKLSLIGVYVDKSLKNIRLVFSDEGEGFVFPKNIESISDLREEKRGLFIVKSYTEELIPIGNKIAVTFNL